MSLHRNSQGLPSLLYLAVTVAAAVGVACLGSGALDPGIVPTPVDQAREVHDAPPVDPSTEAPAIEPTGMAQTSERASLDSRDLHRFVYPSSGLCLPSDDNAMPNARLSNLLVAHEALDFYNGDVCGPVERGSPIVAMFHGTVIRADVDYDRVDADQVRELTQRASVTQVIDPYTLDIYRGRQVWIDHGDGVVTRYAHLEAVADGIEVGAEIARGQPLGTVGDSGWTESTISPGTGVRIHVEVRVGDSFLGKGLPPEEVRRLYLRLFSDAE